MSGTHDEPQSKPQAPARSIVPELPQRILDTYARLWQLETWLRRLVYVELRALCGDDWASKVSDTERVKKADKRLTHMPFTPERVKQMLTA